MDLDWEALLRRAGELQGEAVDSYTHGYICPAGHATTVIGLAEGEAALEMTCDEDGLPLLPHHNFIDITGSRSEIESEEI